MKKGARGIREPFHLVAMGATRARDDPFACRVHRAISQRTKSSLTFPWWEGANPDELAARQT